MSKISQNEITALFTDITYFIEVREINDAQAFIYEGMRLLGIHTCEPKSDYAFIYCLGWPSNLGDVPERVSHYGY